MASLFRSNTPTQTAKMVPNGGLGGFVCPERFFNDQADSKVDMRPARKLRCRPPSLQLPNASDYSPASPAQSSAVSSLGLGSIWTPKTPTDRRKYSLLGSDVEVVQSPASSCFNSATPDKALFSPGTPITPKQYSLVAELPGSLLQPSQGYPQTTPISPPPSLQFLRSNTGESAVSSAPSLSTSVSTEEGTMDTFRSLTSRKHDRSGSVMPTSYTIESRASPAITRPFAVMTIEELLDTLPGCHSDIISQHWLPAMRMQLEKMVSVLNEAGNLQLENSVEQVNFNGVLTTFSNQMRAVTGEYRRVVEQAESLAERDAKASNDRIEGLERKVDEAVELLEGKDKDIQTEKRRVLELQNTIHEVARLLGAFIQDKIPHWVDTLHEPGTQQVLRIIADYTHNDNPAAIAFVRVPQDTINKYAVNLRDARQMNEEYRKVLHGQQAVIKDQGQQADAHADKYEKAVKLVQEKDHEIVLMVQQNDDLMKHLQDNQAALAESQETAAEVETTGRRYDELRGNFESMKTAHELELDQKDAEIANLRQKLGSAREEVFARREDVKNVVAQTQAMLQSQPDPHAAAAKNSNTSKALRFFGMEKDKYKKGNMPGSQSTMGLSAVDARYSSKEVATAVDKEVLRHRPSLQTHGNPRLARTTPNTPVIGFQASSDQGFVAPVIRSQSDSVAQAPPQPDRLAPLPPRSDSLGYGSNPTSPISPLARDKPLPENPLLLSQMATARLAGMTAPLDSPLQAQITSDYLSHGIMGQTAQTARRVLSRITEVSTPNTHRSRDEDDFARLERVREDDGSDHSVASDDREIYRKSINALDMLNSSNGLPFSETDTDIARIMSGPGIGGATGSPPRSLSRHPAATYGNTQYGDGQDDNEEVHTGVARALHLRPGSRDLRRTGGAHYGIMENADPNMSPTQNALGIIGQERPRRAPQFRRGSSGESGPGRREQFRNPARESIVSNGSSAGYRTEDSEPKTVAQMYHTGGKHIRG